jgi:hypothetical protein
VLIGLLHEGCPKMWHGPRGSSGCFGSEGTLGDNRSLDDSL